MNSKKKPGRPPDQLKINKPDWEEAVKEALDKKRPKKGWPKPEEKKKDRS